MKHCFTVDGLEYELRIDRSYHILLAIVGGASPAWQPRYDPFDWEARPFVMDDIGGHRQPFTVLRTALRRLVNWVGEHRPPHFHFSARGERRRRIYRRVASYLTRRFPYQLVEHESTFYFYRLKV